VARDRARDGASGRVAANGVRWVAAACMDAAVGCLLSNENKMEPAGARRGKGASDTNFLSSSPTTSPGTFVS
jgi:hypothetical protein